MQEKQAPNPPLLIIILNYGILVQYYSHLYGAPFRNACHGFLSGLHRLEDIAHLPTAAFE